MPRHPKPFEIVKLEGRERENPRRYKSRAVAPKSDTDIGECPARLNPEVRAVWQEITQSIPAGVLTATERIALEILCELVAEHRADPRAFQAAKHAQLVSLLGRFGLTPADRVRLVPAKEQTKKNPFLEFAQD